MNHCAIAAANADNPTWSRDYARVCEARHLLALPLYVRRDALAMAARQLRRPALEAEMRLQHAQRRSA